MEHDPAFIWWTVWKERSAGALKIDATQFR